MNTSNPCVAHRGWSGAAPENTLTAIRMAVADQDIEMIEVDAQLSKDGVPVVIHDIVLDRTTSGRGMVKQHTAVELSRLDAGSWFAPRFAGEKVPTLEEVLLTAKGSKKLNIELKQMSGLYPFLEEKVVELIRQLQMQNQVIVTSFNHLSVKKVKGIAPELRVGIIISGRPGLLLEQMKYVGASVLSIEHHYLAPEMVEELLGNRMDIIAWTIDTQEEMETIAKMHPSVKICTNRPDVWKQMRQSV